MSKPYLIGITGGTASGKSTFCDVLEKKLSEYKIKVFHMDNYFKPSEQRPLAKAPVTKLEYQDDNHPNTVNLSQLKLDLTDSVGNDYDVIIVEGLLVLWDEEICSQLDLKIFVDCKADERIVRRLRRNMTWGLQFDEIANVYLDMVRFRHDEYVEPTKWKADLIVNGSIQSTVAVDGIFGLVKSKISV